MGQNLVNGHAYCRDAGKYTPATFVAVPHVVTGLYCPEELSVILEMF